MPRVAWSAIGGLSIALAASQAGAMPLAGEPSVAIPSAAGALAVLTVACLVTGVGLTRSWARTMALGAGAALIALRLLVGTWLPEPAPDGPLPDSLHAAAADVISITAPSGGAQRAVIALARPGPGLIRLYARLPRYPEVIPGDRIAVDGTVQTPPAGPGFGDYLRRTGIAGTLTARHIQRVPASGGPPAWLERRRRDAGELLARVLPAPQAGLAAGILVGLRDQVDRDVAAAFTAAGLTHIVAISGWNIAIVAGVVAAVLRGLTRRRRAAATVAAIVAYALAAGAGASVIRAALMAAAVLGSREFGRPGTATTALSLATLSMLLGDPSVVADAGFQLSVAATAGLLAWGTGLTAWLRERFARSGSRMAAPSWLIDALGVSLAAQAATLPLILLDFGRVSLVSPLANLAAAPLVVPVMAASAAALGAGWLVSLGAPAALAAIVGSGGALVLGALIGVGRVAAAMPGASLTLGTPAAQVCAAIAAFGVAWLGVPQLRGRSLTFVVSIIAPGSRRPARGVGGGASCASAAPRDHRRGGRAPDPLARMVRPLGLVALAAVASLILVAAARPDGRLHVSVLDVGQGDALLLQGPKGGRILVDTGPDPERLLPLLDARVPPWDRRLDLLVLTHPHEDHVAGAALLLRRYRVAQVAEPGMRGTGPGWEALRAELTREGRETWRPAAGNRLTLDGVLLTVLWPRPGGVSAEPGETGTAVNNVSVVLDMRYGTRRVLLMGDAEQEVDAALLADGTLSPRQPRVDLLKVAHHGSRTATTAPFLAATRPAVAAISVGVDNAFGHPAPATLDRLRAVGARILRTDRDGTVSATTNGTDFLIESATQAWTLPPNTTSAALVGPGTHTPNGESPGCIESARGSIARGSRRHPARSRSSGLAAGARRRRRGDRLVSGRTIRRTRRRCRPGGRGGRGPSARHRQIATG